MSTDSDTTNGSQAEAPVALPAHARERLAEMRERKLFSSDLSVSEFLLLQQAGFEPLGLVMGSSIYQIRTVRPNASICAEELTDFTHSLNDARQLAMNRLEEEAHALGADGVVGVKLNVNLHAFGKQIAEFIAIGTAVRHKAGGDFRNQHGKPFTSDLSGQDFWTLLHTGWRPVGLVMGNCAYYVGPLATTGYARSPDNTELPEFTHAMYDAREEAMERLQAEAEDLRAEGIVGVQIRHDAHAWAGSLGSTVTDFRGEFLEFFVLGTAVIRFAEASPLARATLCLRADLGGEP